MQSRPTRRSSPPFAGAQFQSEDYDFCLFWDKDVQLAAQLEGLGMRLFNSSDAIAACDDKALTYLRLKPCGIPMPETVIAPKTFSNVGYTDLTFAREIGAQMRYPLIVKECFGFLRNAGVLVPR